MKYIVFNCSSGIALMAAVVSLFHSVMAFEALFLSLLLYQQSFIGRENLRHGRILILSFIMEGNIFFLNSKIMPIVANVI